MERLVNYDGQFFGNLEQYSGFVSSVRKSHTGRNNLRLAPTLSVLGFLAQGDTRGLEHSRGNKSKTNKETKSYACQTELEWMRVAASSPRTGGYPG